MDSVLSAKTLRGAAWGILLLGAGLLPGRSARALPPAPPHSLFGTVRNELGRPLSDGAEVHFEAESGVRLKGYVMTRTEPGVNYRLEIPMDAGLTDAPYVATALQPTVPFRLRVKIAGATYLPLEMAGDFARLGAAGGKTRLDLTLGEDADGNGLPDAWERAVAEFLGRAWTPGSIDPSQPYPGSGMSYRDVYVAGTYDVTPGDGFALQILQRPGGPPLLGFVAVRGRTYQIEAAASLGAWQPVRFRVPGSTGGAEAALVGSWVATVTRLVELEAPVLADSPARFFRLLVR